MKCVLKNVTPFWIITFISALNHTTLVFASLEMVLRVTLLRLHISLAVDAL